MYQAERRAVNDATLKLVAPGKPDASTTQGFANPLDILNYASPSAWINDAISPRQPRAGALARLLTEPMWPAEVSRTVYWSPRAARGRSLPPGHRRHTVRVHD